MWTKRQILDGIFYQLKNGCNWCDLPVSLPPWAVFWHSLQWRSDGVLEQMMTALHSRVRQQVKKKPRWTRLLIVDSQAVKNTCNASVKSKGFCHYKYTNGIKRHLAVDTLENAIFRPLYQSECNRWSGFDWIAEPQRRTTFEQNLSTSQRLPSCSIGDITKTCSQHNCNNSIPKLWPRSGLNLHPNQRKP